MPQPVWSAVCRISTEACHDSSIPSYIGWMFQSKSCTNSAWSSASVPHRIVPTSRRCHIVATSLICLQLVVVPHHRFSSYCRQAFCVAGPSVWNSLLDTLQDPVIGGNSFRQSLKTQHIDAFSALEVSL